MGSNASASRAHNPSAPPGSFRTGSGAGRTDGYSCEPCSACAEGFFSSTPCSVTADTSCSAVTTCAVAVAPPPRPPLHPPLQFTSRVPPSIITRSHDHMHAGSNPLMASSPSSCVSPGGDTGAHGGASAPLAHTRRGHQRPRFLAITTAQSLSPDHITISQSQGRSTGPHSDVRSDLCRGSALQLWRG